MFALPLYCLTRLPVLNRSLKLRLAKAPVIDVPIGSDGGGGGGSPKSHGAGDISPKNEAYSEFGSPAVIAPRLDKNWIAHL